MKKKLLILAAMTTMTLTHQNPLEAQSAAQSQIAALAATKKSDEIRSLAHLLYYSIELTDALTAPASSSRDIIVNALFQTRNSLWSSSSSEYQAVVQEIIKPENTIRSFYTEAFNDLITACTDTCTDNGIALAETVITKGPDAGIGRTFQWMADQIAHESTIDIINPDVLARAQSYLNEQQRMRAQINEQVFGCTSAHKSAGDVCIYDVVSVNSCPSCSIKKTGATIAGTCKTQQDNTLKCE